MVKPTFLELQTIAFKESFSCDNPYTKNPQHNRPCDDIYISRLQ